MRIIVKENKTSKGDMLKIAIVILGNGYDLSHGSKTSYNDFIDFYKEKNNIWIRHFKTIRDLNGWVNVENEFLTILDDLTTFINNYKEYGNTEILYDNCLSIKNFIGNEKYVNENDYSIDIKKIKSDIIEDFIEMRNLLKEYIKGQISSNKEYGKNIQIKNVLSTYDEVVVLNFNYTSTLHKYNTNTHNIFIHGDVNSEIILGHNKIENIEFSIFNKKQRQIESGDNFKHQFKTIFNETLHKEQYNIINRTFDFIVLGHSLDENDLGVVSWVYNFILKKEEESNTGKNSLGGYFVNKFKLFNRTGEENWQDKSDRMYSMNNFFVNEFDSNLPMDTTGNRGMREYERLQEQNLIQNIELTTIEKVGYTDDI